MSQGASEKSGIPVNRSRDLIRVEEMSIGESKDSWSKAALCPPIPHPGFRISPVLQESSPPYPGQLPSLSRTASPVGPHPLNAEFPKTQWPQKVKVTQLWPTLCDPMDGSLPGSSAHGILQARILEWVAVPFSRGSSQPRDQTQVSHISGGFFFFFFFSGGFFTA